MFQFSKFSRWNLGYSIPNSITWDINMISYKHNIDKGRCTLILVTILLFNSLDQNKTEKKLRYVL